MKLDSVPTNTEISVSIGPVGPITTNTLKFEQFDFIVLPCVKNYFQDCKEYNSCLDEFVQQYGVPLWTLLSVASGDIYRCHYIFKLIGVGCASINGHTLRVCLSRYCYTALNTLNIILAQGTLIISCNKKYYVK